MPEPIKSSGRYMAGLDGLRALAVFAVIAYHLNLAWAPGGLLGVDVFFVLSGYLITDLLVAQWNRSGRLNLKDFWLRRARRLLPALLVMLMVVAAWITLIVIDAQIGRQMFQAQAVTAHLKLKGKLGRRVIIELGTNGSFTNEQLISLLHSLGKVQQIVLVNTRVPRPWEGVVNSTLAEVAKTFPHTTLVNWYTASVGKNAYFYPEKSPQANFLPGCWCCEAA